MLSDLITIYIFDEDDFSGEIVNDNLETTPTGYKEIKVKIDEKKILNEINKTLLLLLKNEAVSV